MIRDNYEKVLDLHSIFCSVNGEVNCNMQGSACVFIRLSGCSVRCAWCDTKETWRRNGNKVRVGHILNEVDRVANGTKAVTITGGEPLEQLPELLDLVSALVVEGYIVSIETSGAVSFKDVLEFRCANNLYDKLSLVVDYKLPSSMVEKDTVFEDYAPLQSNDFIKLVVSNSLDFDTAVQVVRCMEDVGVVAPIFFSANPDTLSHETLFNWMQATTGLFSIVAGLNVQLHKLIYSDVKKAEDEVYLNLHKNKEE